MFLYFNQQSFKLKYFTKYFINYIYFLNLGLHLGGTSIHKHMTNTSLIYELSINKVY